MNAGVPEIETERLILRAWRADDFDAFASFMADEETVKYVAGQPLSRPDAWRSLATMIGHW
jgi:RimJ/RimL family protein N-acetyltransferase